MIDEEMPRYVYHGTDAETVQKILKEGLQPREATDRSNWDENNTPSIPDHVYLTRQYPAYFGVASRDSTDEPIAIIEVDLDKLDKEMDLYPDEDFIEQALNDSRLDVEIPKFVDINFDGSMRERTKEIRDHIELFRPYWEMSLLGLGNISHKGTIPPNAIRRISIVHLPSQLEITMLDASINIEASVLTREKHEAFTQWLMGEDVTVEDIVSASYFGAEVPDELHQQYEELFNPEIIDVQENKTYSADTKKNL